MPYQEPEKSQLKWEKTINTCQHKDETDVGIIYNNFKAAIKMFHVITNMLEKMEK